MTLDDLRAALAEILSAHPEIRIGELGPEFLTLAVEPDEGPCRSLRAAVASLPGYGDVFSMRWSSYRGQGPENCDGGTYGDLAFTLGAIEHWIVMGMPWQTVPEFKAVAFRGSVVDAGHLESSDVWFNAQSAHYVRRSDISRRKRGPTPLSSVRRSDISRRKRGPTPLSDPETGSLPANSAGVSSTSRRAC